MPNPTQAPPTDRRSSATGTCPCCGQPLGDQEAVEQVRKSGRDLERKLDAAARTMVAELVAELAVRLKTEREDEEEQRARPDPHEEHLATAKAHHEEDLDVLRTFFRQF